jgi:hypothetical protein
MGYGWIDSKYKIFVFDLDEVEFRSWGFVKYIRCNSTSW